MNDATIILACGAVKARTAMPALELYQGSYFLAARGWALSVVPRDRILVLSAKHGILRADEMVRPYDARLGVADVEVLARKIYSTYYPRLVNELVWSERQARYFAGGARYLKVLRLACVSPLVSVVETLPSGRENRGIGAQLRWLTTHRGELPEVKS